MTTLHHVTSLDLPVCGERWDFETEHRARIDAHFAKLRESKPQLWNGRVLLCRRPRVENGIFRAEYFEADFASFIAWRDWGFPDTDVFNGFGAGALCSADGAFILGEMAAHTANAGRVYFPAGTPEPADIVAGKLDMQASIIREMEEETGVAPSGYRIEAGWTVVRTGQLLAFFRRLSAHRAARELVPQIETFLRTCAHPELSRVVAVRSADDFQPEIREFVQAYLKDAFAAG
ncbi:MAG: NUDIX hydrolase [Xanthobacteraceae bacterium]